MADAFSWLIRFVHVMSGVMWVGGAFLWGMIIAPNVMQRGPPAIRKPFLEAVMMKMSNYLAIAGALTIVSGFWTMGLLFGWANLTSTFEKGAYGMALSVGVLVAVIMLAQGLFVIRPTAVKLLAALQAAPPNGPPPAEVPALGKKLGINSMIGLVLGTIALGAMAWAVNLVR